MKGAARDCLLEEIRQATVIEYREALAMAMAARIACFSADQAFLRCSARLARDLRISIADAQLLLHPVVERLRIAVDVAARGPFR
jgi:hypothetical protein